MTSIQEVLSEMDLLLARWEPLGDYRAVFVRSYRIITAEMLSAIQAGEFEDNDWMTQLDVVFAQKYFDALNAWNGGDTKLPRCWKFAFDQAHQKRTTVMQDLLLGMTAHIVHDLPLALFKAGMQPNNRDRRLRDHQKASDILGNLVNNVQREAAGFYSVFLRFLDRFAGDYDEMLTDQGIRLARAQAWDAAVRLADASSEIERTQIRESLDIRTEELARSMVPQRKLLGRLIPGLRRIDRFLAGVFDPA